MYTKQKDVAATTSNEQNNLNNNITIITHNKKVRQHYITLHPGKFPTKESFDMPRITNWFKRNGVSQKYTLQQIFEFTREAKAIIPSHIESDGNEYTFISSSLMFIDVDDDDKVTEPLQVLQELKEVCAGLFYTSSHSKDKNRYRLVFVLSEAIRNEQMYKLICEELIRKLINMGVPADNKTDPLQRMRTGTKGYVINNIHATLPIEELRENAEIRLAAKLQKRADRLANKDDSEYRAFTLDELKERAEAIGYVDEYSEWIKLGLSLKSYVMDGHITDEEGYEVFSILCNGADETKTWEGFGKRDITEITIGTFINESKEKGYKTPHKYFHALPGDEKPLLDVEVFKTDKYIPIEYSKELLKAEQKILVKSPTGSGKTHSFMNASKQLAEELKESGINRFFILSVPTIAITDQVAADNQVMAVRGQTGNLYSKLKEYVNNGNRVLVCTYDMTSILVDLLSSIKPFCSFAIVIDEVHQLVHNYSFRYEAIESLYALHSRAKSFIGLSGTPEDVLRDNFEREVHIQTKNEAAPCQVWGAVTYETKSEEKPLLLQLMKQKVEAGRKLLVFIQNKQMIKDMQTQLRKMGVQAASVASDGKLTNTTYKTLVNESRFPEGVQVVLTTSVLSDGINIKNEDSNYECILVASNNSPMFNVDQARQCANRFRNMYRQFIVYMQQAKKDIDFLYNIESSYKYEKTLANNAIELINEEFKGIGNSKLLKLSRIEKRFGIKFNDQEQAEYNVLRIRYNASYDKSNFYALYRGKYIEALEKVMGKEAAPTMSATEIMKANNIGLSSIEEELKQLEEAAKLEKAEKRANIGRYYTKAIYEAFHDDSEESELMLKAFKTACTGEHYSSLKGLVHLTDYENSLHLVQQVTKQNNINAYKHRIEALVLIEYFTKVHRQTPSREAYGAIFSCIGQVLSKEQKDKLQMDITRAFKRSKKVDVKHIMQHYFYHEEMRSKKERFTILRPLTKEIVANEFTIPETVVFDSMKRYARNGEAIVKEAKKKEYEQFMFNLENANEIFA